jgi:5-methylcytosine-specific restriction endonuclease McrA
MFILWEKRRKKQLDMKTLCANCRKFMPIGTVCECQKARQKQSSKEYGKKHAEKFKMLKNKRWHVLRKQIIKRDGGHCQRCLINYNLITTSNLEVHHIKPRDKYPELTYEETNCVTLCKTCNLQLGTQETLDFPFETEIKNDFVL